MQAVCACRRAGGHVRGVWAGGRAGERAGERGVRVWAFRREEHVQAGVCQGCRVHMFYVLGRDSRGASAGGCLLRCPVLLGRDR